MKRFLVIFLLVMVFFNLSYQLNDEMNSSILNNSLEYKQKLIKCKICQEMFEFNFNFDEFLKSNKIQNIINTFGLIEENKKELDTYFSNDNMEFITKEISMQYFFKGTESQFDEASAKNKECKSMKVGNEETCDKLKFEYCEKVLSFEDETCQSFKKSFSDIFKHLKSNKSENKKNTLKASTNSISNQLSKTNFDFNNFQEIQNSFRENNNSPKFSFMQKNSHNIQNNMNEADNIESQFGNISLMELKQDRTNLNLNPLANINQNRSWTPPKPVLLDNFQTNIGDQLKDISALAR